LSAGAAAVKGPFFSGDGWPYFEYFDSQSKKYLRVDMARAKPRYGTRSRQAGPDLLKKAFRRSLKWARDHHLAAPTVLDLTAGLLSDAFHLRDLGFQVNLIEREPLLMTAIQRIMGLLREEASPPIQFVGVDAKTELLKYLAAPLGERPLGIYYDPMFFGVEISTGSGPSALPKKSAQFLRTLCASDQGRDQTEVLTLARALARCEVVVKRPHSTSPILNDVSHQIDGKSIRYDVYLALNEAAL
jgi:16S rRNA (guanine1516-N2)-methyltransferase